MIRSLIVALTPSFVIGRANTLPWRLSEDLKRFKRLTMGHHLIMGRKTFDSIGKPLPGRTSIVITRDPQMLQPTLPEGVIAVASLGEAFQRCGDDPEVFIIGGGEIFVEALNVADRAYVTWVDSEILGDVYFPPFPSSDWHLVEETTVPADAKNEFPTRYCVYDRRV
jgi:dihydrofolate reductase